ncbi:MAG: hypothetical protein WCO23_03275 [bacterium]
MGIKVEFNPDLALRNIAEYEAGNRKLEECILKKLEVGKVYPFLKNEMRNYYLLGEVPLIETRGNGVLSKPKASVIILEVTHFVENEEISTRGKYKVIEVVGKDDMIFEGFDRIGVRKDF